MRKFRSEEPRVQHRKVGVKVGCLDCARAICDECDSLHPNCKPSKLIRPDSYWKRGCDDAKAGRRFGYSLMGQWHGQCPGYLNGYHAGKKTRADALLGIRDREIADAVNELRDIANQYHGTDQLRERIAGVVVKLWHGRTPDSTTTDTK